MKTLVILNHKLNEEQISDLGGEIVELDPHEKKLWANIPSDGDLLAVQDHIQPILDLILISKVDQVICQGEFSAFTLVMKCCESFKIPLMIATSNRESVEEVQEDGSVVKKNIFRHIQFRRVA